MLTIKTNNHWRDFVCRYDVPEKVLACQFDWTNKGYEEHGDYSDGFIHYKGCWYHIDDFMRVEDTTGAIGQWHGYASDSFFSGVLIKLSPDGEQYQIATYIS
jgi:hypothetical protein